MASSIYSSLLLFAIFLLLQPSWPFCVKNHKIVNDIAKKLIPLAITSSLALNIATITSSNAAVQLLPLELADRTSSKLDGKVLFRGCCATCHANGGNKMPFAKEKTLRKEALAAAGYTTVDDIARMVTEAKGMMVPFGPIETHLGVIPAALSPEQIKAVSQYVLDQSLNDWK
mmetsp:Transcript_3569/g.9160  ORF Transcript_3569/g.9160 Transcript_3569/m.9160 type:complete len:172 (+) Transcript_3569:15-530(+)